TEVEAGTNVADVKAREGGNGQTIYTVNAKGTTATAGSDAITVEGTTDNTTNITDYKVDLSQDTKDSLVKADTALQEVVTQIDGTAVKTIKQGDNTANFVSGDNIELSDDGNGGIKVATKDDVTFNNTTINNDLTVGGTTKLGDNFTVNNDNSVTYTGPITEGNHITNKTYVDKVGAASRTEVEAGTNVADVKAREGGNGQTSYTVNAKGTTATAGSDAITVEGTTDNTTNITHYKVDLSQDTKDSLVKADTALQEVVTQIDGTAVKTIKQGDNTANFVSGDNIELSDDGNGGIKVATKDDVTINNTTINNDLRVVGTTTL